MPVRKDSVPTDRDLILNECFAIWGEISKNHWHGVASTRCAANGKRSEFSETGWKSNGLMVYDITGEAPRYLTTVSVGEPSVL